MTTLLPSRIRRRALVVGLALLPFVPQRVTAAQPPATIAAVTAAVPAVKSAAAHIDYYGVYLSGGKLGSATITRDDYAMRDGKPAIRTEMRMDMTLLIAGASNEIITTDVSWIDPKSGAPIAEDNKTEGSGRVTDVLATYSSTGVTWVADIEGSRKTGTIALPPGKQFLVDPTNGVDVKPAVGMKATGVVFVPEMFKLIDASIEVVAKENVTINGLSISAYKVIDKNALESSTLFANEDGDLLRIDNSVAGLPMQILKESQAMALAPAGTQPDLIALTSNHPTGASMTGARRAKSITYRLGNVSRPLPASDTVESIVAVPASAVAPTTPENRTVDVTVHATPLPDAATAPPLFADAKTAPTDLQPYLLASTYVDSADPRFHAIAESVLGTGPTNCVDAAQKIAAYVHKTVKPDPSIAALRSATDVCNDPRGVCRDYTALFAAIARAAGLPTKQCFGVAYDGRNFVGHAWPEVWTGVDASGANHWTAIEPTWGVPFADATHLKLAEGELTDFFTVAGDMTRYKIDVLMVE